MLQAGVLTVGALVRRWLTLIAGFLYRRASIRASGCGQHRHERLTQRPPVSATST